MKTWMLLYALMLGLVLSAGDALAQVLLRVGDPAPPLAPGKWIKGEPVKSFEPGKVYVVEFWATWCMPCRESIPRLSRLQARYKDVIVIGQNVWDRNSTDVEALVALMGNKMDYRVALDDVTTDRRGVMARTWMEASGQRGIPAAFVVGQAGKVVWIGFPTRLDQVLPKVLDGAFDALQQAEHERVAQEKWKEFSAAQTARDTGKALVALDELGKMGEDAADVSLSRLRVLMLLQKDGVAGMALARNLASGLFAEDAAGLWQVASVCVEAGKPGPDQLAFTGQILERAAALELKGDLHHAILRLQARVWAWQGLHDKAVEAETRVVAVLHGDIKRREERVLEEYRDACGKTVK